MHQALQLTEIFEIVCSFTARTTLACLARTCRTFEDPSLNVLWHELDPAECAFAHLLPGVIFERMHSTNGKTISPELRCWERMRRNMSRVAVVKFKYGYSCPQPNIFAWLLHVASLPPSEPQSQIFPRLKEIHISGLAVHDQNLPLFRYVNGPSVTKLELNIDPDRLQMMPEFIASLTALYPNVRRVQITVPKDGLLPERLLQILSKTIHGWRHLVHGSFNVLNAPAYEHLCQLETLTSFHLDISRLYLQEAKIPPVPFPALTDFHLVAHNITGWIQWIDQHNLFPLVSNLTCGVEGMHPQSVLKPNDLCNSIAAHFRCQSLQAIHLYHISHFHANTIVPLSAFQPLFSFSRLRSVILSHFCTLSVDDGGLEALASSWPLAEELDLCRCIPEKNASPVDIPTFRGLFKLVECCPRLRVLAIVIDTRDSAWVDLDNPCYGACARMVSRVLFGNSPINDGKRVASILRAVFPSLERVDVKAPTKNVHEENELVSLLWNEVNTHLAN